MLVPSVLYLTSSSHTNGITIFGIACLPHQVALMHVLSCQGLTFTALTSFGMEAITCFCNMMLLTSLATFIGSRRQGGNMVQHGQSVENERERSQDAGEKAKCINCTKDRKLFKSSWKCNLNRGFQSVWKMNRKCHFNQPFLCNINVQFHVCQKVRFPMLWKQFWNIRLLIPSSHTAWTTLNKIT